MLPDQNWQHIFFKGQHYTLSRKMGKTVNSGQVEKLGIDKLS